MKANQTSFLLQKPYHKINLKTSVFIGTVFIILFLVSYKPAFQKLNPIVLQPQALPIVPNEFYMAQVVDERTDKSAVAYLFPLSDSKQKPALQAIDFKGGIHNAIQGFIFQSLPRDKKLRPIVLRIKECKVTETAVAPGKIEGKVAVALAFDLMNDVDNIHLTDYRLDTKYVRPDNQPVNIVEPALRESFVSALKYFNTWINSQANANPKLAKAVNVSIQDYHEKPEGDTIYYASNRPLNWNDFQEKTPNSKYAASVFPSLGFDEKREIVNGVIKIQLSMKIYVPKSACWVKNQDRTDYTLNHEQRHFDIVAIVGKHFEQKIKSMKLSVTNPDGPINMQYYESFREMNHLQDQYDAETRHGINTAEQERWNKRIDDDLVALGVKKNNS